MSQKIKKYWPLFFLSLIVSLFFWKTIYLKLIPFPGDMLVGAYYPWLDYKWGGFETSVPIKNPLISDVFSQIFIWRDLIKEAFINKQIPLWNPYSYSGYPLLANFQSGVFNPLNLFLIFFGSINGWSALIISQFLLSAISMYFLLKNFKRSELASLAGSISYAFSGFMVCWSQFNTAGFALIYLPLIFLSINLYFQKNKTKYLFYLSPLLFLLISSGHFQAIIYTCSISFLYFLCLVFNKNKKNIHFFKVSLFSVLGIGLIALQILPTIELAKYSLRFDENYIKEYNYGLLSFDRITTIFAPDFFGNPTTFNYWGNHNYHESIIYIGIAGILSIIYCLFNFKKLKNEKFFLITSILSLLFAFDTILGKSIFLLNIPGLSTSSAGRIIFLFTFSTPILISYWLDFISKEKIKNIIRYYWGYFLFLFIISLAMFLSYKYSYQFTELSQNYKVSLRNLVIPIFISSLFFLVLFIKNKNIKLFSIIFLIIFDLFRFGWKYTPFVNQEYFYPKTSIIDFLQKDKDIFRIEKEKGPLLTPNTWTAYRLMSTSGYDPMAIENYSLFYEKELNDNPNATPSRYAELGKYNSISLGKANVKYLLALKYNEIDDFTNDHKYKLNRKIDTKNWISVFEEKTVVVLENKNYKPRVETENNSYLKINSYTPNKIKIEFNNPSDTKLILRDTYYPGWIAQINNNIVPIERYNQIYRQIHLPKGEGIVEFIYQPKSFTIGLYISLISLTTWLILIFLL